MLEVRRLSTSDAGFPAQFKKVLLQNQSAENDVHDTVTSIIKNIREQGDQALLEYTKKFDQLDVNQVADLEISQAQLQEYVSQISDKQSQALHAAAKRIRTYAEKQSLQSWLEKDDDGNQLGQKITSLEKVGIYVPGGKAAYPSSVLMNALPAKVAGVENIYMVVPTPKGEINPMVMAAAAIAGVDRVFTIGGAQAVAALAFGTETIPKVDKIVGPGNAYVASAKQQVFGQVGIDMLAGPSEVLIICDASANPEWVAMDLFSQAEHDAHARTTLISTEAEFFDQVQQQMEKLIQELDRKEIIQRSVNDFGVFIQVKDLAEAAALSNQIAPEHLELSVAEPEQLLEKIRNAGAVFLGHYSPEVFGDYCAGPNHVLPTASTARFSSPLGVYDFQKRISVVNCSKAGAEKLSNVASTLAHSEGLTAHARSAEYRGKK